MIDLKSIVLRLFFLTERLTACPTEEKIAESPVMLFSLACQTRETIFKVDDEGKSFEQTFCALPEFRAFGTSSFLIEDQM